METSDTARPITEDQIIGVLREHVAGVKTADLCRKHGISDATF
jgi:putative transposase